MWSTFLDCHCTNTIRYLVRDLEHFSVSQHSVRMWRISTHDAKYRFRDHFSALDVLSLNKEWKNLDSRCWIQGSEAFLCNPYYDSEWRLIQSRLLICNPYCDSEWRLFQSRLRILSVESRLSKFDSDASRVWAQTANIRNIIHYSTKLHEMGALRLNSIGTPNRTVTKCDWSSTVIQGFDETRTQKQYNDPRRLKYNSNSRIWYNSTIWTWFNWSTTAIWGFDISSKLRIDSQQQLRNLVRLDYWDFIRMRYIRR